MPRRDSAKRVQRVSCGRDARSSRPAASSRHPYRQLSQRELVPGGLFQSFQNPLNRSGVSFVYRTVEAIERWPR
jgi:hypothetical protein